MTLVRGLTAVSALAAAVLLTLPAKADGTINTGTTETRGWAVANRRRPGVSFGVVFR